MATGSSSRRRGHAETAELRIARRDCGGRARSAGSAGPRGRLYLCRGAQFAGRRAAGKHRRHVRSGAEIRQALGARCTASCAIHKKISRRRSVQTAGRLTVARVEEGSKALPERISILVTEHVQVFAAVVHAQALKSHTFIQSLRAYVGRMHGQEQSGPCRARAHTALCALSFFHQCGCLYTHRGRRYRKTGCLCCFQTGK